MSATQDYDDATEQDNTTRHDAPIENGISPEGNVTTKHDSSSEDKTSSEHNSSSTSAILSEGDAATKHASSPEDSNATSSTQDSPSTDESSPKNEPSEIDTVTIPDLSSE